MVGVVDEVLMVEIVEYKVSGDFLFDVWCLFLCYRCCIFLLFELYEGWWFELDWYLLVSVSWVKGLRSFFDWYLLCLYVYF